MASINSPSAAALVMETSFAGTSISIRAALSTPVTAIVMTLAQWPHVMSGTRKVIIESSFLGSGGTINLPIVGGSRLFFYCTNHLTFPRGQGS